MNALTNNLTARQWSFLAKVLEAFFDAWDEVFGNVCTNRLVFELDHGVLKETQNKRTVSIQLLFPNSARKFQAYRKSNR